MAAIKLSGVIVQKAFGKGSKSEHQAIYIESTKGDFVLRKVGANPFDNKGLIDMVGKKVEVTGTIKNYVFLAEEIRVIKQE